jgi:hypothetical protein
MTHELKTWPEYFQKIGAGKTFELRRDDRDYRVGDKLRLREWCPDAKDYTGSVCRVRITYILRDAPQCGLQDGFVVMAIVLIG